MGWKDEPAPVRVVCTGHLRGPLSEVNQRARLLLRHPPSHAFSLALICATLALPPPPQITAKDVGTNVWITTSAPNTAFGTDNLKKLQATRKLKKAALGVIERSVKQLEKETRRLRQTLRATKRASAGGRQRRPTGFACPGPVTPELLAFADTCETRHRFAVERRFGRVFHLVENGQQDPVVGAVGFGEGRPLTLGGGTYMGVEIPVADPSGEAFAHLLRDQRVHHRSLLHDADVAQLQVLYRRGVSCSS